MSVFLDCAGFRACFKMKPYLNLAMPCSPYCLSILKRRSTCYHKEGKPPTKHGPFRACSDMWKKDTCRVDMTLQQES